MKTRTKWVLSSTAILIIASTTAIACSTNQKGVESVRLLQDPAGRDRALFDLLEMNGYYHGVNSDGKKRLPETCKVNHVVVCPQKNGLPLYAVFKAEGYEKYFGGGPGKPLGHVIVFDSNGKYLPWYINANSIHGEFEDVNGDGIVENIESIHEGSLEENKSNDRLWVLPVVPNAKPILEVRYDPKRWSYKVLKKGPGIAWDIQFVPKNRSAVAPVSTVTYRWSKEKQAYEGSVGSERIGYWRTTDPTR